MTDRSRDPILIGGWDSAIEHLLLDLGGRYVEAQPVNWATLVFADRPTGLVAEVCRNQGWSTFRARDGAWRVGVPTEEVADLVRGLDRDELPQRIEVNLGSGLPPEVIDEIIAAVRNPSIEIIG